MPTRESLVTVDVHPFNKTVIVEFVIKSNDTVTQIDILQVSLN